MLYSVNGMCCNIHVHIHTQSEIEGTTTSTWLDNADIHTLTSGSPMYGFIIILLASNGNPSVIRSSQQLSKYINTFDTHIHALHTYPHLYTTVAM